MQKEMSFKQDNVGEILELAEVLSDTGEHTNMSRMAVPAQRKISKTSLLFAILASVAIMFLTEVITSIYKSVTSAQFTLLEKDVAD